MSTEDFDRAVDSGIPKMIIKGKLTDFHEGDQPRIKQVITELIKSPSIRVVLLTGLDTPYKDLVASFILQAVAKAAHPDPKIIKSFSYYTGEIAHDAGRITFITAVMGVALISGSLNIAKMKTTLHQYLLNGNRFLLGVESLDSLESIYGSELVNFLSHRGMTMNVGEDRKSMIDA